MPTAAFVPINASAAQRQIDLVVTTLLDDLRRRHLRDCISRRLSDSLHPSQSSRRSDTTKQTCNRLHLRRSASLTRSASSTASTSSGNELIHGVLSHERADLADAPRQLRHLVCSAQHAATASDHASHVTHYTLICVSWRR